MRIILLLLISLSCSAQRHAPLEAQRLMSAESNLGVVLTGKTISAISPYVYRIGYSCRLGGSNWIPLFDSIAADYPILGSTLASQSTYLPSGTGTFTLTPTASPTTSNHLVVFDGVTQYLNSNFNDSIQGLDSWGFGIWESVDHPTAVGPDLGCVSVGSISDMYLKFNSSGLKLFGHVNSATRFSGANSSTLGFFVIERQTTFGRVFKNGVLYINGTSTLVGRTGVPLYFGGANSQITPNFVPCGQQINMIHGVILKKPMSAVGHLSLYNAITILNTDLL